MTLRVAILVLILNVNGCSARASTPEGIARACATLRPGHGSEPETTVSPFAVVTSKNSYSGGDVIDVTLEGRCGEKFTGFLLQARRADPDFNTTEYIGSFRPVVDTQAMCVNAGDPTKHGLGHSNPSLKTSVTVQWTAPETPVGHIVFKALFVKGTGAFWSGVTSAVVSDPTAPSLSVDASTIESSTIAPCPEPAVTTQGTGEGTRHGPRSYLMLAMFCVVMAYLRL